MLTPLQLEWVHRNHQPAERVESIGSLAVQLAQSQWGRMAMDDLVVSEVAAYVDDAFRRHCSLQTINHGQLVVLVDHPSLVYPMRVRWQGRLGKRLVQTCRSAGIRSVFFKQGRGGHPIGSSEV